MSNRDFIPKEDGNLVGWFNNFATQCDSYSTLLGLTAAEVASIEAASSNFSTAWNGMNTAHAAAKEATTNKNTVRRNSVSLARQFAREFKANPTVPESLLEALGVVGSGGTTPVVPVTALSGVGQSDGVNQLRWNRNGNSQGTTFVVEYRIGTVGDWLFAGVTSRTRFSHTNQQPGVEISYRVIASRSGVNSVPCSPVVLYAGGGEGELSIAA